MVDLCFPVTTTTTTTTAKKLWFQQELLTLIELEDRPISRYQIWIGENHRIFVISAHIEDDLQVAPHMYVSHDRTVIQTTTRIQNPTDRFGPTSTEDK